VLSKQAQFYRQQSTGLSGIIFKLKRTPRKYLGCLKENKCLKHALIVIVDETGKLQGAALSWIRNSTDFK
jgi:hypothetical protein